MFTTKTFGLLAAAVVVLASYSAQAAGAPDPDALKAKVNAITAKFQPHLDQIRERAGKLQDYKPSDTETAINVDADVKMEQREIKLHIPEVAMREQTWKLHVPEVTMKLHTWRFHLPGVCMKYKPFPWGGGMHVPEPCMKENVWKLHVPEVAMRLQTWKLHVPEVTMKLHTWILHLPTVTVRDVRAEFGKIEREGQQLAQEGNRVADQMKSEINAVTTEFLNQTRAFIDSQFAPTIEYLRKQIAVAPNDQIRNELRQSLETIEAERATALSEIDENLAKLS